MRPQNARNDTKSSPFPICTPNLARTPFAHQIKPVHSRTSTIGHTLRPWRRYGRAQAPHPAQAHPRRCRATPPHTDTGTLAHHGCDLARADTQGTAPTPSRRGTVTDGGITATIQQRPANTHRRVCVCVSTAGSHRWQGSTDTHVAPATPTYKNRTR